MIFNKKGQKGDSTGVLLLFIFIIGITIFAINTGEDSVQTLTYDLSVIGNDVTHTDRVSYNDTDKTLSLKEFNGTSYIIGNLSFEDTLETNEVNLSNVSKFDLTYTLDVATPQNDSTMDVIFNHTGSTYMNQVVNLNPSTEEVSGITGAGNGTNIPATQINESKDVIFELEYDKSTSIAYASMYNGDTLIDTITLDVVDDLNNVTGLEDFQIEIYDVGNQSEVTIKEIKAEIYE